jgi:hypothetical protein
MSRTTNLNLPLIQERQAQKHITMNESLVVLDILTQLAVESKTLTAPPASLVEGATYIIPSSSTGAWENKTNQIAFYHNNTWHYITPQEGFSAWDKGGRTHITYSQNTWRAI